jgi:hypothetical protein
MNDRVGFFQIVESGNDGSARVPAVAAKQPVVAQVSNAPKRVAAAAANANPVPTRGPARRMQAALATAVKVEPDWKEF